MMRLTENIERKADEKASMLKPYSYSAGTTFKFIRKTDVLSLVEDDKGFRVYVPNELLEEI